MHGQVARLEVQRDTLKRVLTQEQANAPRWGSARPNCNEG